MMTKDELLLLREHVEDTKWIDASCSGCHAWESDNSWAPEDCREHAPTCTYIQAITILDREIGRS
jgi:hypothetical protein